MGNCWSTRSRKAEQLDMIQKWRDSHSSSVRSSMIARKDGDVRGRLHFAQGPSARQGGMRCGCDG